MARPKKFDPEEAVGQAMDVFWAKGFAGATPKELGDRMGIGRGSLYNEFASKRDLFTLALERYETEACRVFLSMLVGKGRVRPRLRKFLLAIVETDLSDPERRGCLGVNAAVEMSPHDAAAKALVTRLFAQTERHVKAAIEEGQSTGEIDASKDAAALASFVLNAMIGMRVIGKVDNDDQRLRRVVDTVMQAL
jgi:TetR/AcrR family transcriptional repressor of nem operon